jgi:imidazolonepropionase-like amidohydrolase
MHGRNYMEIVHLVRDGLPPLRAWYGATGLAAREIGMTDTGTIEKGQRADLLLCRGDVVSDPSLLDAGALREVLKDGRGHRGMADVPQRTFADSVRDALG